MAKRSNKQSGRSKKNHPGCMWGLISIFDFRHSRSTRRLISDRKRGNGRHANGTRKKLNLLTDSNENTKDMVDENTKDMVEGTSDSSDGDERKTAKVDSCHSSVKTLIDEEMSEVKQSKNQIPSAKLERSNSENGLHYEKNHDDYNMNANIAYDHLSNGSGASARLAHNRSHRSKSMERFSTFEEIPDQGHPREESHLNHENESKLCHVQKSSGHKKRNEQGNLEERMGEAAEAFLSQKLIDATELLKGGPLHRSKEFMDALDILNSNRDLFLKLLQDPNSLLVQHIRELQNAEAGVKLSEQEQDNSLRSQEKLKNKQNQKQSKHRIFGRKDKMVEDKSQSKGSHSSQATNRIVILKPSPVTSPNSQPQSHLSLRNQGECERAPSNFSIREIKRKLKHAIGENGKERHWIFMDAFLHRIPYGHGNSRDNDKQKEHHSRKDNEADLPNVNGRKNMSTTTVVYSPRRESAIYEEAKKHLAETLNIGTEDGDFPMRRVPRTLGRILSMPENNVLTPKFCNESDKEPRFENGEMRFSPSNDSQISNENGWWLRKEVTLKHLSRSRHKVESSSSCNCHDPNTELQFPDSNSEKLNREDQRPTGAMEITEIKDAICMEQADLMVAQSKLDSDQPIAEKQKNIDAVESCAEEDSSEGLRLDPSEDKPTLASMSGSFSGSPLHIHKIDDSESICEKQERPSPVSVLDQFYVDDVISPGNSGSQHADSPIQPRQIHFGKHDDQALTELPSDLEINLRICVAGKESIFEYVRTVLETSGLSHGGVMETWYSSDQALSPSLFDELEASFTVQSSDNRKLLFDCVNEVLMEVHERFFRCSPWVSFVKTNIRPVPMGKNLIQEAWEGIDRLHITQHPRTLEQIIAKDMERDIMWMDLRPDVEGVDIEMGDGILDRLMEETILELWE